MTSPGVENRSTRSQLLLKAPILPGNLAQIIHWRRKAAMFKPPVNGAPAAILTKLAGSAVITVLLNVERSARMRRNKLLPSLTHSAPAKIIAHGGLLNEGAERHAAVGINMKIPPAGNAGAKKAPIAVRLPASICV